ncbi:MAG TPA: thioesterase family protein [Planctomycetota bacterium]|jgi:YbgC/YbaW family acyl-CoA thioester hydrolase|nr:thioesterase family protein [Planctomycetota bacterium]
MPFESFANLRVRSYELDSYGHVNNAVYMQWLEHGRSRHLQDKGFDYHAITQAWGVRLVTVSTKIDYRASLHLDDDVKVLTTVERIGRTSVTYKQAIFVRRDDQELVAADGSCTIVFTDAAMTTPMPVPVEFKALYA